MKLLILLCGNKDKILQSNGFSPLDFEFIKLDEKLLASPKAVISIMKSKKYDEIYFGTIENGLQRFQTFMMIYFLLAGFQKGGLIDELANRKSFSLFRLIFADLPLLALEIVLSGLIALYFYIKLPFMIKKIRKGN